MPEFMYLQGYLDTLGRLYSTDDDDESALARVRGGSLGESVGSDRGIQIPPWTGSYRVSPTASGIELRVVYGVIGEGV